jgi:hypothetical protein
MIFRTALLLVALLQEDEFQKRVRIDGLKVRVDEQVLHDGPWKDARVDVVDFTGKRARQTFGAFEPWKQIVLTVDGEERLRIPVKSLAKPIAWPPVRADEVQPSVKRLTETVNGKKSLVVQVSTDRSDFEIYRGPEYETRAERTPGSFTVFLNGDVLYRVSRAAKPPPRVEDVAMAVNLYRVKAGLGTTRPIPGLSKACDLHALYLTKNEARGLSGHEEDAQGVGYTEEGARAGRRSVISPFAPQDSPLEAVDSLMATLYHRVALLNPSVGEIGIGWATRRDGVGVLVVDVGGSEVKADAKIFPIVYPVNAQEDVPLEFGLGARENPNPLPDENASAGYPVTIQIPERRAKSCDAELQLLDASTPVPSWISTPDSPARKDWPQPGVISLIPKEKLKPATIYTVRFKDRLSGLEKEWSFTTRK